GKNDGGIDIRACIRGIDFVFQCKNWESPIVPSVVRELDEAFTQPENNGAIGVVVIPDNSRPDDVPGRRWRTCDLF
ncbi:15458_t:CDS:2, partial [Gigaspora rosea]